MQMIPVPTEQVLGPLSHPWTLPLQLIFFPWSESLYVNLFLHFHVTFLIGTKWFLPIDTMEKEIIFYIGENLLEQT